MNREILVGDVLEKIKEIPDKTIDCVITSPPYWSLRDYSVEGQWGLEPDFHQYLAKMGRLMDELRRVLKDTGTCWINLGDTYNEKTRIGIPERFYINCIDSGWIARNNIVWSKNNTMPSSVKDRFTNKYESVFFFVKQQKYYFNLDAVREKSITPTKQFNVRVRDSHTQRFLQGATEQEKLDHNKKGERKCDSQTISKTHNGIYDEDGKLLNNPNGKNPGDVFSTPKHPEQQWIDRQQKARENGSTHDNSLGHPNGKNPGDLFQINTRPYAEAHFATFPPELPTKILKCGCKPGGIVLDCFFGSGTVGEAAEKLGLRWIGIELNKEYVKLAKKRLGPYLNQTRLELKA